jgi:RNA binding exosome subunit
MTVYITYIKFCPGLILRKNERSMKGYYGTRGKILNIRTRNEERLLKLALPIHFSI